MSSTSNNAITIKEVKSRCDLLRFVKFGIDLYKGNPYYCPPIIFDEVNTFRPSSNPALDVCDYVIYMAYRNNKIEQSNDYVFNREETNPFVIKHCDNVTIE